MPTDMDRRTIQVRLKRAVFSALNEADLPNDGRHLSRVSRSLVHIAADLLLTTLPPTIAFNLLLRAALKAVRAHPATPNVGVIEALPPAKA